MTSVIAVCYRCSQCGRATDWEEALGPKPLCAKCWDKETASSHKAELTEKEFSRRYQLAYEGDIEEEAKPYIWILDGIERQFRRENYHRLKERINRYRRAYWKNHRSLRRDKMRHYRARLKLVRKNSPPYIFSETIIDLTKSLLPSERTLNIKESLQYYVTTPKQIDFKIDLNVT